MQMAWHIGSHVKRARMWPCSAPQAKLANSASPRAATHTSLMPPHLLLLLLALCAPAHAADNGEALLPPMGWRSWNCFYADISDAKIRSQIDALTKPHDANGTTLKSLGYASIGIDEGWAGCSPVHYANGTPAIDAARFPDMRALVEYGHSKGIKMGFYLNGCGCHETVEKRINYEGDVRATVAWGFDAVKIDRCGAASHRPGWFNIPT